MPGFRSSECCKFPPDAIQMEGDDWPEDRVGLLDPGTNRVCNLSEDSPAAALHESKDGTKCDYESTTTALVR